jgi:hypothetical protein
VAEADCRGVRWATEEAREGRPLSPSGGVVG